MSPQSENVPNFGDMLHGFERTLHLESLAELGRQAKLVPVRVVACVVDIRDFTKFVDEDDSSKQGRAPEFLKEFFSIFPKAVLREGWDIGSADPLQETNFQARVREMIVPTLSKKLGDGVLLVWEIDQRLKREFRQGARYAILDIVGYIQEYFYKLIRQMTADYSDLKLNLKLGIGLAAGRAWRHDYSRGGQIDYFGRPLNLASRLQNKARPEGICVHASFEPNYLLERAWAGEGHIKFTKKVDRIDPPVPVWCSTEETLWLREAKPPRGADLSMLKKALTPPYSRRRELDDENVRRGLTVSDVRTLLDIREELEASFAQAAAVNVNSDSADRLSRLIAKMETIVQNNDDCSGKDFRMAGQEFHEEIAFTSGGTQEERLEHSHIIHDLHESTTNNKNYPHATQDLTEMLKEHREIATAIMGGNAVTASRMMHAHLKKHHDRVKISAFGRLQ